MDSDSALKAAALRINRAGGVAEKSTRKSLEYSPIDKANTRWLIIQLETPLIGAEEALQIPGAAFAIMTGEAKIRVAVGCPVGLDGVDRPAQPFNCARGAFAFRLVFCRIELLVIDGPFKLFDRLIVFA